MKKLKYIIILFVVLFTAIALAPRFLTPYIEDKIRTYLKETDDLPANFSQLKVSFLTQSIVLENFILKNPDLSDNNTLLEANQVELKVRLLPLFKKQFNISKIKIHKPKIVFYTSLKKTTNWDYFFNRERPPLPLMCNKILIENGILQYLQEISSNVTASAEFRGIFIYIRNNKTPIAKIHSTPLFSRIKARGYIPTKPKGYISLEAKLNLIDAEKTFQGSISMKDISIPYFNKFRPQDTPVYPTDGSFSLKSDVKCYKDKLAAIPEVTIKDLRLKLSSDYEAKSVFELPVVFVIEFLNLYKEEIMFTFTVRGTLYDPKFNLKEIVSQEVTETINESIMSAITKNPELLLKLGNGTQEIIEKFKDPINQFIEKFKGE